MPAPVAKFALEFPQGHIIYADAGIYYRPNESDTGYMVYGDRKELFGKQAVTVSANRETGSGDYAVVHEFKNGALTDARLIQRNTTIDGKLADEQTLANINADLASGELKLRRPQEFRTPTVYNVAQFADGRLLVQLMGEERQLWMGKPGELKKLDAQNTLQGGGSMYYRTADGINVALPYGLGGPGHNDIPKFGEEELTYLHTRGNDGDPAKYGIIFPAPPAFLDPFSKPATAAPSANAAFKAPKP